MKLFRILAIVALTALAIVPLRAEKVDLTPADLAKTATHVVVGKVLAVYERHESTQEHEYTRYLAELRVDRVEKGDGLAAGGLVYARYWQRKRLDGRIALETAGHRGLPKGGERLRIYLARNAYDGFTHDNRDGGFNVIGANGFESIAQAAPESSDK